MRAVLVVLASVLLASAARADERRIISDRITTTVLTTTVDTDIVSPTCGNVQDTTAVQDALTTGKHVHIPCGVHCKVDNLVATFDDQVITGCGFTSVIDQRDPATGCMFSDAGHAVTMMDIAVTGHVDNSQKSVTSYADDRTGLCVTTQTNSLYRHVYVHGFGRYGIKGIDVAGGTEKFHVTFDDVRVVDNWTGIYLPAAAEYTRINNVIVWGSYWGLESHAGNMIVSNSTLLHNGYGLALIGTGNSNNGHGTWTGGQINHSGTASIYCKDITIGFSITGVQVHQGDVILDTCSGVMIRSGELDTHINAIGGQRNEITDNLLLTGYSDGGPLVTHSASDHTITARNFYRDGGVL